MISSQISCSLDLSICLAVSEYSPRSFNDLSVSVVQIRTNVQLYLISRHNKRLQTFCTGDVTRYNDYMCTRTLHLTLKVVELNACIKQSMQIPDNLSLPCIRSDVVDRKLFHYFNFTVCLSSLLRTSSWTRIMSWQT